MTTQKVYAGIIPFVGIQLLMPGVIATFPGRATGLPNLLFRQGGGSVSAGAFRPPFPALPLRIAEQGLSLPDIRERLHQDQALADPNHMEGKMFKRLTLAAIVAAMAATTASAQELRFFRIGTGGTAGTYYPIGGLLANAISNPPGSRPCDQGGSCGVPGLVASAVSSNGSVANVNAIAGGTLESGFAQSDVANWAHSGTGIWEGKPAVDSLRAIANLYPESIHLVARADAGIASVADLKGKKVSLDEPGSGTLVDARIILEGYGLTEADVTAEFLKPNQAADRMRDGQMDAFFFVGGFPAGAIAELASSVKITLVPIEGDAAAAIRTKYPFFAEDLVPGGTYDGVTADTKTLAVGAQWITSAAQPDDLIYEITKALWNDGTRKLLDSGHSKGKAIRAETGLAGVGIPLHAGAEKFYREAGLLK